MVEYPGRLGKMILDDMRNNVDEIRIRENENFFILLHYTDNNTTIIKYNKKSPEDRVQPLSAPSSF